MAFLIYDLIFTGLEGYDHPSRINQLVASLSLVVFPLAASGGFYIASATRALGLHDLMRMSASGYAVHVLRMGRRTLLWLLVVPIAFHLSYLATAGVLFVDTQWLAYLLFVPAYAFLGFILGTVAAASLGAVWRPRSVGLSLLIATIFGMFVFFGTVSLPPTGNASAPLNLGLVSTTLVPVLRISSAVLIEQAVTVLAVGVTLLGVYSVQSGRHRHRRAGALVLCSGVVGVTALSLFAPTPGAPIEKVAASRCVGSTPAVCHVPLEARGASRLSMDLADIQRNVPAVIPPKVVQVAAPQARPGFVSVMQMPSDHVTSARYASEVVLKWAQCEPGDVVKIDQVGATFERLVNWLIEASGPMPDDLQKNLSLLRSSCTS